MGKSEEGSKKEQGKTVKGRNTIHTNPALVIHNGENHNFDNKEAAEDWVKENLEIDESCTVYLQYKSFSKKEVRSVKIEES